MQDLLADSECRVGELPEEVIGAKRGQRRCGDGGPAKGEESVEVPVFQRGRDSFLDCGRVLEVHLEDGAVPTNLGQRRGEATAALLECEVVRFVDDAECVADTAGAHALSRCEPGLVFVLANVEKDSELAEGVAPGVDRDDRNARPFGGVNRRRECGRVGQRDDESSRPGRYRRLDQLAHARDVGAVWCLVGDRDAELAGGGLGAVLDDGPEGVGSLPVRDDDEPDFVPRVAEDVDARGGSDRRVRRVGSDRRESRLRRERRDCWRRHSRRRSVRPPREERQPTLSSSSRFTPGLVFARDRCADACAAAGWAFDREPAVEGGDAVAESAQPTAMARVGATDAVVTHLDDQGLGGIRDGNDRVGRVRVPGDVGERFGDDEVDGCLTFEAGLWVS